MADLIVTEKGIKPLMRRPKQRIRYTHNKPVLRRVSMKPWLWECVERGLYRYVGMTPQEAYGRYVKGEQISLGVLGD